MKVVDQDLQLSCWALFHLSPRSTGNLSLQLAPSTFWKLQNHPCQSSSSLSLLENRAPPPPPWFCPATVVLCPQVHCTASTRRPEALAITEPPLPGAFCPVNCRLEIAAPAPPLNSPTAPTSSSLSRRTHLPFL